MAEILANQQKAKFGSVKEISAVDYINEVNKAGDGIWVVLHLYKTGQVAIMTHHNHVVYCVSYTVYHFVHCSTSTLHN